MEGRGVEASAVRRLARGWGMATLWAAFSALVLLALSIGAAALAAAAGPGLSFAGVLRTGALLFLWCNRVALRFVPGGPTGPATPAFLTGFAPQLTITLLLGTVFVVWLLALGARRVADRVGGPWWQRALRGAAVAIPYAVIVLVVGLLDRASLTLGAAGRPLGLGTSPVSAQPDALGAFVWPLVLGVVAGLLGGARSNDGAIRSWERRVRAAVAGGGVSLTAALAAGFVGLLLLAALSPSLTRSYVQGMFGGGAARGLALLAFNLLVLPGMSAWLVVPAMGSCVGLATSFSGGPLGQGTAWTCLISYGHMPSGLFPLLSRVAGPGGGVGVSPVGPAPAWHAVFLVVPAVSVLLGGRASARGADARTRVEGAGVGAMSGVVFAALVALVSALATIGLSVASASPRLATVNISLGPDLATAAALALAWGVIGGAVGGGLFRPTPPGAEAWQPATGERPTEESSAPTEPDAGTGEEAGEDQAEPGTPGEDATQEALFEAAASEQGAAEPVEGAEGAPSGEVPSGEVPSGEVPSGAVPSPETAWNAEATRAGRAGRIRRRRRPGPR